MNCNDYQTTHNLSDAQLCRLLNERRPSPADSPVFEHRLAKLKRGESRPRGHELRTLMEATDDQADSYS